MLLAVARVSGETAPLLFTALNNQFWSADLNAPMASLPVVIFQFALSPYKDWQQLAWTGALLITAPCSRSVIAARALFEDAQMNVMSKDVDAGLTEKISVQDLEFYYGRRAP